MQVFMKVKAADDSEGNNEGGSAKGDAPGHGLRSYTLVTRRGADVQEVEVVAVLHRAELKAVLAEKVVPVLTT
jgi:hypothetical protein